MTIRAKRASGDGGIRMRFKGDRPYWVASVSSGADAFGKRRRAEVWCASEAEAIRAKRQLERDIEDGVSRTKRGGETLADYLEQWTHGLTLADATILNYRNSIRDLAPFIGRLPIASMCATKAGSVELVRSFCDRLRKAGASDSKVRKAYATLSVALSDAVPQHIKGNPCRLVSRRHRPKQNSPARNPYNAEELNLFLRAIEGDPLEAFYGLALSLMCKGEILALKRENVLLDEGLVHVVAGKTKNRKRYVKLPPFVIDALRRHLAPAAILARGDTASPLVFCRPQSGPKGGQPLSRSTVLQGRFYPLLDRHGLRRITLHDLRCSIASAASSRAPALALKQQLGHGSLAMTAHYGGHHNYENGEAVAAAIQSIFFGPGGQKKIASGGKVAGKPRLSRFSRA